MMFRNEKIKWTYQLHVDQHAVESLLNKKRPIKAWRKLGLVKALQGQPKVLQGIIKAMIEGLY
jgi:hypothetical protein